MRTEMALLIAKTEHRLEQLTKPLFERDVVEELIREIKLLERGDKPPLVAREIADCHNRIEELEEELDEAGDALREARFERDAAVNWAAELKRLGDVLMLENRNLKARLSRLVPANEAPRLIFEKRAQEALARAGLNLQSSLLPTPEFGRNSPD